MADSDKIRDLKAEVARLRQGRKAREGNPENKSGNSGRNGGHNALTREFLHEPF